MDYVKLAEEALETLHELLISSSKKEKQVLLENIKGNQLAEDLLALAKDKNVKAKELSLVAKVAQNEGRLYLQHILDFLEAVEKSKKYFEASAFQYVLRNIDEKEAKIYEAILSNLFVLETKESTKQTKQAG